MLRRRTNKIGRTVMLALFVFLFTMTPHWGAVVQTGSKSLQTFVARRHYWGWQETKTAAFQLRYTEQDEDLVQWLSTEADDAAAQVASYLPYDQTSKPWLVLAPDQATIKQVFGWGEGTGALGVYQADTITLLSPNAWVWEDRDVRLVVFAAQNPLVHEYTHYVLDKRANGNYPNWFSEGLASLVEYRIVGYEWIENGSSLTDNVYVYPDLVTNFHNLSNQALAYRQSLSMVSYLDELQGMEGLNKFINLLGAGNSFGRALQQVYGMDEDSFYSGWQKWYPIDVRWSKNKN